MERPTGRGEYCTVRGEEYFDILVLGIGLLVEGRGGLVKRRGISGRRRKGAYF